MEKGSTQGKAVNSPLSLLIVSFMRLREKAHESLLQCKLDKQIAARLRCKRTGGV
jgi:hypothetical protein